MPLYTPRLPLIGSGQTVTTSQPLLDLTQTWNDAGVTFSALKLNVTATASAAALSLLVDIQANSISALNLDKTGSLTINQNAGTLPAPLTLNTLRTVGANGAASRFEMTGIGGSSVISFNRSNGSTLTSLTALLSGDLIGSISAFGYDGTAQSVNSSAVNFFAAENWAVGAHGTRIVFNTTANTTTTSTARWSIENNGHLLVGADNTYDIGASGATRPRNLYIGNAFYSQSDTGGFYIGASNDVILVRDAANTLALRNGTAQQTFNLYRTWTDASNYERFTITNGGSGFAIYSQHAGTGSARPIYFGTGNSDRWQIDATGNFLTASNNVYDIGSALSAVRSIYVSTSLTFSVAAAGPILKQGANGRVGTFVLNGTTPVAVSNTSVAVTDAITISLNTVGGVVGVFPSIVTITAGTGFSVAGTAADTSTYNYAIIKNAA